MLRKVDMELLVNRMEEFSRLFKKLNGLILQYYDINESAIHIFSILKKEELTLKQLTEESNLDKSTMSRQVNSLVKKDLIIKTRGQDKRYTYLKLSREALDMYKQYQKEAELAFADLLTDWSEEEKQSLSVLLLRLNRRFDETINLI